MINDLISRSELTNLILDSKSDDLQQSDINFLTGDIKVSLRFILNIIDKAPSISLQALYNGIVELISKHGITTIDELLETLKGGAE